MDVATRERYTIRERLASFPVLFLLGAGLLFLVSLLANFILRAGLHAWEMIGNLSNPPPLFSLREAVFQWQILDYPIFYGVVGVIAGIGIGKVLYDLRQSYKKIGTNNEKGSQRFSTEKELRKQYKAIPERTRTFKGQGGPAISRTNKWNAIDSWRNYQQLSGFQKVMKPYQLFQKQSYLLVDDSAVNNLIIGTTRSGKGEMFVFPTIDAYSRGTEKPSMVFNDPKGELYRASKETLEKRGYHLEVMNLDNPNESMSYNLLQLIKDAYKDQDYSTAQLLCQTLTHSLYHDPNSKDPMWNNLAGQLVNAMILAITDKCVAEEREDQICMYAVANMLTELGGMNIEIDDGIFANALDLYFQNLPEGTVAKLQYASSKFSEGKMRSSIFATAMDKLQIFTFDEIARMTSRNSIDLDKIGYGKKLKGTAAPYERVHVTFANGVTEKAKAGPSGRWKLLFDQPVAEGDTIQIEDQSYRVEAIDHETGEVAFNQVKEEAASAVTLEEVVYFNKPVALFIIIPDYDTSVHVISSIFIRQLYFVLAKNAGQTKGGKCYRQVVFMLDEFGNMPSIQDMPNIITVCLGRNIRFNLIVQGFSQLPQKYGKEAADTIIGNCGNQMYIHSLEKETAEKFSWLLGNKTQRTTSRSGNPLALAKSENDSLDAKPLLTPNELMELNEGETVVLRNIKRQDKKRNRIRPRPIFNRGKTAMKYRWEYLTDDFDTDVSIMDVDIACSHRDVKPKDLIIYFEGFSTPRPNGEADDSFQDFMQTLNNNIPDTAEQPEETNESPKPVEDAFSFDEELQDDEQETEEEERIKDILPQKVWGLIEQKIIPVVRIKKDDVENWTLEELDEHIKVLASEDVIDSHTLRFVQSEIDALTQNHEEELPI
ncbi:VirD4-like conjugal transfer protein, CD1115 family [Alkalicoccobacillus gibsonii]|uniref:VirD4-like conjugal transfer protein, CD1115 family n=1 Tax=Alkalicoccobacillus gibsonii TaxID=79881 RepID=UPI001FEBCCC9|nr:type IV secretory system conjugative DNA transfer family protein [Alkalicoccobacillus gibsonii]